MPSVAASCNRSTLTPPIQSLPASSFSSLISLPLVSSSLRPPPQHALGTKGNGTPARLLSQQVMPCSERRLRRVFEWIILRPEPMLPSNKPSKGERRLCRAGLGPGDLEMALGRRWRATRCSWAVECAHAPRLPPKEEEGYSIKTRPPRHGIWDDGYTSKGAKVRHKAVARLPMTRLRTFHLNLQRQRPVRPDHRGRAVFRFGPPCACGRRSTRRNIRVVTVVGTMTPNLRDMKVQGV